MESARLRIVVLGVVSLGVVGFVSLQHELV